MAVTAGHAWNSQTVSNAAWEALLPSGSSCEEIVLKVDAASASSLRIAVRCKNGLTLNTVHRFSALTTPVDDFVLAAEEQIPFAGSVDNRIEQVFVRGASGTATFSGTITKA